MAKKEEKKTIATWINLGILVAAVVCVFLPWIKISVSLFGYSASESYGIMSAEGGVFIVAKILAVVGIIAAILAIVNLFVDLKTVVKPLEKVDVAKLAPMIAFGSIVCALVFALIGIFSESSSFGSVSVAFGFIIEAVIATCGLCLSIKPGLLNKVIKTK